MELRFQTKEYTNPNKHFFFSVFTSVFNRANTIHRVYNSLIAQTEKDFEWLVVDDGSTDNLPSLMEEFIKENKIAIRYFYQQNQGKHIAYTNAIQVARGEMMTFIDSDDAILPEGLATFKKTWLDIPQNCRKNFRGIGARCIDSDTHKLLGSRWKNDIWDVGDADLRLRYHIRGENWECTRIDLMRQYPFPQIEKECRFCPENIVWFEISKKYKTRFLNIGLRIYFQDTTNSLTGKNYNRSRSNYHLWKYMINEMGNYTCYDPISFLKGYVGISMDGLKCKKKIKIILSDIKGIHRKLIALLFLPAGWILSKL